MSWGGHLNLIWKGILLRMYAQQALVKLLHQRGVGVSTDKGKSNGTGWKSLDPAWCTTGWKTQDEPKTAFRIINKSGQCLRFSAFLFIYFLSFFIFFKFSCRWGVPEHFRFCWAENNRCSLSSHFYSGQKSSEIRSDCFREIKWFISDMLAMKLFFLPQKNKNQCSSENESFRDTVQTWTVCFYSASTVSSADLCRLPQNEFWFVLFQSLRYSHVTMMSWFTNILNGW